MEIVSVVKRGGRGLRIGSWDGAGRLGFVVGSGSYLSKHVMDERSITRCDAK
jgi:hypothetical protein